MRRLNLALLVSIQLAFAMAASGEALAQDREPELRADTAPDGKPLAGRYGDFFYVRDAKDEFRLYFGGRAHVDTLFPFGPGVTDTGPAVGLNPSMYVRRARVELGGEFLKRWQWQLSGDWGPSAIDNPGAQSASGSCSIDPTTGAANCPTRSSSVQAAGSKAVPTDVYINYKADRSLNLQIGQFRTPITIENRTSENYAPFLESSLAVRNLVGPYGGRDIGLMFWGETAPRYVHYSVGIFNGDGPNRPNVDARGDVIGRAFFHPFIESSEALIKELQVGASFRYGVRSAKDVGYDVPAMTTTAGYAFWRPTYVDSTGSLVHILPTGDQSALAAELYWPAGPVDITSEIIWVRNHTREARDLYQLSPYTERYGTMNGFGYYATVGYWIMGSREDIRKPGYSAPAHIDFKKPAPKSRTLLEALVRFEQLHLEYDGASRKDSISDPRTPNGTIQVNALTLGMNYWATRRVRVSGNYTYYSFPGSEPVSASSPGGPTQNSDQRALAPAQTLPRGVNDAARDTGHSLHELIVRVAVAF